MKHLFRLTDLSSEEIMMILTEAKEFKAGKNYPDLTGKRVINAFFEPSTRTQYSFMVAESKLGMLPINFNVETSSVKKGESLYDTLKTFEMIGIDALVVRHPANNYFLELDKIQIPILSGGDGTGNHPTQSLLDLLTIQEEFGNFTGLKIAIVGDIRHSRVAHTNIDVMTRMGMEVSICGPEQFNDSSAPYIDYELALKEMDIIMLLRVQFERHGYDLALNRETYYEEFGLTEERVHSMKDHAIIMHPAPYNRGVEISNYAVECSKSRIMKQMHNGVYVRMAVLKRAFSE
ncbi:MAG: aspartate carbamoyltransferase catalytic subunit [Candidatus Izemoplasmatales bacterium]|nr:aspartate carbamoyltransferase catalytic subunit [Candidatus Izemoplasmatales bacterium]MDD4987826.1 aspartate carbamoyltransferase catalytic subunit [Candidatus Izemoplasmatales bacterium]MDY0372663.1 aspartate carbamoyltransferase catalytic subunit [Candidatus Izemoplasmatales bacterium]